MHDVVVITVWNAVSAATIYGAIADRKPISLAALRLIGTSRLILTDERN